MERTAVAVRHVEFEHLGRFAPVLEENGFRIRYADAIDGLNDLDGCEPGLLVVLGGPIGAYQQDDYPWLARELHLLTRRLQANRPTLGICLGAQLMARALGARVYAGKAKEIGWSPLMLTDEGEQSCLRALAADGVQVLHWHGDTFELPAGAKRLASTPVYENQAFSWGGFALALQFHAEVTASGLERWYVGHACELAAIPGFSVADFRAESIKKAERLREPASTMLRTWLAGLQSGQSVRSAEGHI